MITTDIIIGLTVVGLLAYDLYAYLKGGIDFTISWQVIQASKNWPLIPFFFGLLMGHFFWQL